MVASNPELQAFGEVADALLVETTTQWRTIDRLFHSLEVRRDVERLIDMNQDFYAEAPHTLATADHVEHRAAVLLLRLLFVIDQAENSGLF